MQCGLCPSRNQVAMIAVFLVSDFDRCVQKYLCRYRYLLSLPVWKHNKGKSQFVMTVVPSRDFISPSLDKSQSAPCSG